MADLFYVNSGYVTDHYFVYTADASASVTATCTISVTPTRIRRTTKTVSAVFSVSARGLRLKRGTNLIFSTAIVSARANAIYRLGTKGALPSENPAVGEISAVSVNGSRFITAPVGDLNFNRYTISDKSSLPVISIWMKGTGTLIAWGVAEGLYDTGVSGSKRQLQFTVNDTTITMSGQGSNSSAPDGSASGSWTKPADDGQWHHYFIIRTSSTVNSNSIAIWRDGNSLSGSGYLSTYMSSSYGNNITIGNYKSYSNNSPYYADRQSWTTACFAQVWINYIDQNATGWTDYNSWVNEFYHNGAVDLTASTTYSKTLPANGITSGGAAFVFDKLTYPFSSGDCDFWITNADTHGDKGDKSTPTIDFICTDGWVSDRAVDLQANFALYPGLSRIKTFRATLSSSFSIRAITGPVRQARTTLASQSTISKATARSTQQAYAKNNIIARATVSKALANPIKRVTKTLSAAFSFRGRSTTAVFGRATLASAFSVKAKTSASSRGRIVVASSVFAYSVKTRFGTSTMPARATLRSNGGLYFNGNFRITVVSLLSASLTQVPRSDDDLTIPIEAETRTLRVLQELRLCTEEATNRVNRTLYEDRVLIVPAESRTIREVMLPVIEITPARIRRLPA